MSEKNIYLLDRFLKLHLFQLISLIILLFKGFIELFIRISSEIFFKKKIISLIKVSIIKPIDFFFFLYLFLNDKNNLLFSKEFRTSNLKKNYLNIYISIYKYNNFPFRILSLLLYSNYNTKNKFLRNLVDYYFFNLIIFFLKRETIFFSNKDSFKWKFNFFKKKKFGFYTNNTEIKDFIFIREMSFKELNQKLETNKNINLYFKKKFLINNSHFGIDSYTETKLLEKKKFYKKNLFKYKINSITLNQTKYKPIYTIYYKIEKFLYKNVYFKISNDFFISNNFIITHEAIKNKYLNLYGIIKIYLYKLFRYEIYRYKFNNFLLDLNQKKRPFNKKVIFSTSSYLNNYFHYIFEIIIPNYFYFIKYKKKIDVVMSFPFNNLTNDIMQIFQNKIIKTDQQSMNFCKKAICGNFINKIDNYFPAYSSRNDVIHNQFYINKNAVNMFSEKVISCSKDIQINKDIKKETLFIKRSSSSREFLNYKQFENVFSDKVDFCDISNYGLFSQANIFMSYNKIISPAGSALTNLLFCKPNTEILILLPKYNFTFFHFWQYIADIRKINISYIDGNANKNQGNFIDPVNCDFYINLNKINDFVV